MTYKSWFWPLQFRAMQVLCDTMSRKLSCTPVGYTIERERESLLWSMNLLRAIHSKAASNILTGIRLVQALFYDLEVRAGGMQRNEFGGVVEKFRASDV